ncbi:MAG: ATP-binding protein [Erysipelotrichaceae bacterium]|nr:ATP-binding protein [Erysipelotrichaceae bacterium]
MIIGRIDEQEILKDTLDSKSAEFLVVYGRRRIGKTHLIKEYFNDSFSFYFTGLVKTSMDKHLKIFDDTLKEYGYQKKEKSKDWFDAFRKLKDFIENGDIVRDPYSNKIVIFLDEAPWMDTARSDFRSALDYFWNSYASRKDDLVLIVCGSATSWIIDNLLSDRGGFYNRVTRKIHLLPFSLKECEEYCRVNGIAFTRKQIIESYMIFGGIPFYLKLIDKRLSLDQNVDALLFNEKGQLYHEYDNLLNSLFVHSEKYAEILRMLSKNKGGLRRQELSENKKIGNGEGLTKALNELEQCGFIRKYQDYTQSKQNHNYQLIDPFMIFSYRFLDERKYKSWLKYIHTPSYYSWLGNAFETVCLIHSEKIKDKLRISGIESNEYSFRTKNVQIDLIIDRKDDVINLCEIKYTSEPFRIDEGYNLELQNKIGELRDNIRKDKAIHMTMISLNGIVHNEYSHIVINEITGDDLF